MTHVLDRFFSAFRLSLLVSYCCLTLLLFSCNLDSDSDGESNFDREELLDNLAKNIIVPSYRDYQQGVLDLKQRAVEFVQVPNNQTLNTLRQQFETTYLLWQKCSFYNFGPASDVQLKSSTNTFPVDKERVEFNIQSGDYNLDDTANQFAKGFPAIDLLIFGDNLSTNQILINYVDNPSQGIYLQDIIENMVNEIDLVVEGWIPNGDNFQEVFIVQSGTERGSSLSDLVNELNRHLEISNKEKRIGIPLGTGTSGLPAPEDVEAFYSMKSIPYISENLQAMRDLFRGDSKGVEGIGLDDWLNAVNARFQDDRLSDIILTQFDSTLLKVDQIQDPLSQTIIQSPEIVNEAYSELQDLSLILKVEMPAALGINIHYDEEN